MQAASKLVAGLLLAATCASAVADEPSELKLGEAVALAMRESRDVRLAGVVADEKRELLRASRRLDWPMLRGEFQALYGSGEPTSFHAVNNTPEPDSPLPSDSVRGKYGATTVLLSAPIYQNGGFTFGTTAPEQVAAGAYAQTLAQRRLMECTAANRTAKAYFGAIAAADVYELHRVARERLERARSYIAERAQAGVVNTADELSAEAALVEAGGKANAAQRERELQQTQLAISLGRDPASRFNLAPVAYQLPTPPPVDVLIQAAVPAHPGIEAQDQNVRTADAMVKAARGELLPRLSLEAAATQAGNFEDSGERNFGTVGLKVSVPLSDFLTGGPKVEAQKRVLDEAQANLALARDAVVQTAYSKYNAYLDAIDQINTLQSKLAKAAYQKKVSAGRYETKLSGLGTMLEDDAAALQAQVDVIEGRRKAWEAYADLLLALGRPYAASFGAATAAAAGGP